MNKIDCIEDYFTGTMCYYWFYFGNSDYILDKKYLNAAKVAFASNIMLGIKEDLIETRGAMDYHSKVFLDSLEQSVSQIARKVEDGYKVGNYVFPDASTLVAIVRNKLAHGKYKIDFDHNRVILEHKGIDIVINIEKLVAFIISAFGNTFRDVKQSVYERKIVYLVKKTDNIKNGKIKNLEDVKKIIRSFNYAKFKVESLNGLPVFGDCISMIDRFVKYFYANPYDAMKSSYYKEVVEYLKQRNCKLSVEYCKLHDSKEIDRILDFVKNHIIDNNNLTYEQKLTFIGMEVQRSIDGEFNGFSTILASVNNIMLLDAITRTHSVNRYVISSYINNNFSYELKTSYDEFGMVLLSKFNALFMYPFDDVFETSGEYKVDRDSSFDFSNLDLSMVNPNILTIDESPLNNALDRCNSLVSRQAQLNQKIAVQKNNLLKVKGNSIAEKKISDSISDLTNSLSLLITEYAKADSEYNNIKNDYTVNKLHFKNRTIIEGIRNAIAHGNYEFVVNGNFADTLIIFSDIYEGKITFQVTMTFQEFDDLINNNYVSVLNFIRTKRGVSKNTLSKK